MTVIETLQNHLKKLNESQAWIEKQITTTTLSLEEYQLRAAKNLAEIGQYERALKLLEHIKGFQSKKEES